jgi:hypothetical protein
MANARERLTHLVELASQSAPEKSRALALELCDLLLDWPEDYSPAMRVPFEALMEKVVRGLDPTTRKLVAARLASSTATPIDLLNGFFFDVPAELKQSILARNDVADSTPESGIRDNDAEAMLLDATRADGDSDFSNLLGKCFALDRAAAELVASDARAFAIVCRGSLFARATYSSVSLLRFGAYPVSAEVDYAHLDLFDDIPPNAASRMLQYWRSHSDVPAAAEVDMQAA